MGGIIAFMVIMASAMLGANNPLGGPPDPNTQPGSDFLNKQIACAPSIDITRTLTVDVTPELDGVYGESAPYDWANKENKQWVLVKQNAPIAAWKVLLEQHSYAPRGVSDPELGEMEKIGTTENTGNPNEVYVGIGWCNPESNGPYAIGRGHSCLDPLVQDTIFVLTNRGADLDDVPGPGGCPGTEPGFWLCDHGWGEGTADDLYEEYPQTPENLAQYWWTFDVYYDASKLPANPTNDDLPCWMQIQCPNGGDIWGNERYEEHLRDDCYPDMLPEPIAQNGEGPSTKIAVNNSQIIPPANAQGPIDEDRPRLVIKTSLMNITESTSGITLADEYLSSQKLSENDPPNDPIIGTAYEGHFWVRLRTGNVSGTSSDHALILDPRIIGYNGPYWMYVPILKDSKPIANSLQLGSFVPGIPSYFYEWWTPSCKPAIYLYPEETTKLSVSVDPKGYITESIPEHGTTGWHVIADPDGTLTNLRPETGDFMGNYLYYEAAIDQMSVPRDKGWIKSSDELFGFFYTTLPKLGLNEQETKDFMDYWMPKLTQEGDNWYITLLDREELDRVEPVTFSKQPDNFIRIRFYFENLDNETKHIDISSIDDWNLDIAPETITRTGFTAVDWGGVIGNGSCGVEERVE